jgi:hypothetical protein
VTWQIDTRWYSPMGETLIDWTLAARVSGKTHAERIQTRMVERYLRERSHPIVLCQFRLRTSDLPPVSDRAFDEDGDRIAEAAWYSSSC